MTENLAGLCKGLAEERCGLECLLFTYEFYQFLVKINIEVLCAGIEEYEFRKFPILRVDSSAQVCPVLHHGSQGFSQEVVVDLVKENLGVLELLQAGHLHPQHLRGNHQELRLQLPQVPSLQDNVVVRIISLVSLHCITYRNCVHVSMVNEETAANIFVHGEDLLRIPRITTQTQTNSR